MCDRPVGGLKHLVRPRGGICDRSFDNVTKSLPVRALPLDTPALSTKLSTVSVEKSVCIAPVREILPHGW
jgi:hypothetical protein